MLNKFLKKGMWLALIIFVIIVVLNIFTISKGFIDINEQKKEKINGNGFAYILKESMITSNFPDPGVKIVTAKDVNIYTLGFSRPNNTEAIYTFFVVYNTKLQKFTTSECINAKFFCGIDKLEFGDNEISFIMQIENETWAIKIPNSQIKDYSEITNSNDIETNRNRFKSNAGLN